MKKKRTTEKKSSIVRRSVYFLLSVITIYSLLLIPDPDPPLPEYREKIPFVWDRDSLWLSLENDFIRATTLESNRRNLFIDDRITRANGILDTIVDQRSDMGSLFYDELENSIFNLAPLVAANPGRLNDYILLLNRTRNIIKDISLDWDMNKPAARQRIYRLLYGGRAALEEVMLQAFEDTPSNLILGYREESRSPSAQVLGVTLHSGDILVSRGGAPTSALIARGSDYPGNFSHVALVHIDQSTAKISIIESHIEMGVAIATFEEYLRDKKLRIMVLRLRSDLPLLRADPMLPHKAASFMLDEALSKHIPYDFEMDYNDNGKMFCSEVASYPFGRYGINLWMGISHISSQGIVRWLSYFGVRHFETQEPSDLEYDPQLRVVAEWRDQNTLFKDHIDNAVIDVMLEYANEGEELDYSLFMLPIARAAKFYSGILNLFGVVGPVPEGMSATAGLRNESLSKEHRRIKDRVEASAAEFLKLNGYRPPYWKLIEFAREGFADLNQ